MRAVGPVGKTLPKYACWCLLGLAPAPDELSVIGRRQLLGYNLDYVHEVVFAPRKSAGLHNRTGASPVSWQIYFTFLFYSPLEPPSVIICVKRSTPLRPLIA